MYCRDHISCIQHDNCENIEILSSEILAKIVVNIDTTFREFALQDLTFDISGEIPLYSGEFNEWYKDWKDLQTKVDHDTAHDKFENFEALQEELTK